MLLNETVVKRLQQHKIYIIEINMKAALFIISIYIIAVTSASASNNSRILKRKDENQERKRRNRDRGKVVEHTTDGEEILKGTSGSPHDGTIPQMNTVRGDRKHKTEEELILEEIVIEKRIKHEERKKEKALKRHKREDSEQVEDEAIADTIVDGAIVVAPAMNTTTEIEERGHGKHIKFGPNSSTSYAQQVQRGYGGPVVEKEKRGKKGPDPVMNKHGPPGPRGEEEEEKELALQSQLQNSSSMLRPTFLLASVVFVLLFVL